MTQQTQADREALIAGIVERWTGMSGGIRPTPEVVARYERALLAAQLERPAKILLLGSTPELRSLVAAHGHALTGADIDEPFWAAMTRLLTASGDERFIHGDWLALAEDEVYDLILGDGSLNMLSWPDFCALVAKLRRLLRPGGRALLGIQTSDPAHTQATLAAAIAEYPGPRTDRAFVLAIHGLVESLRSRERPELGRRGYYEQVVARYLGADELDALRPLLRDKRNFYPTEEQLLPCLREHFDVLAIEPCPGRERWAPPRLFTLAARP